MVAAATAALAAIAAGYVVATRRHPLAALRGEPASPTWQYGKQEAAVVVREVLQRRARLGAACPAGTALAACADALAGRGDLDLFSLSLRRYLERLAQLDALRVDLR